MVWYLEKYRIFVLFVNNVPQIPLQSLKKILYVLTTHLVSAVDQFNYPDEMKELLKKWNGFQMVDRSGPNSQVRPQTIDACRCQPVPPLIPTVVH
jgi:hypothetical protein